MDGCCHDRPHAAVGTIPRRRVRFGGTKLGRRLVTSHATKPEAMIVYGKIVILVSQLF